MAESTPAAPRPRKPRAVSTPVKTAGGPTRRPPREKKKGDALEARILEAAVEEFSEHGFAGARIERISQGAGTVDRMLYYYYGNKERLYQAVLTQAYATMIGAQREFVRPDDPIEGMRQLVMHSWDHYVAHPELVRLLMNENLLRGKHIVQSEQVKPTSFPLVETVQALLDSGQARGLFRRDVSTEHVLMTIMSLGFFYVSNQYTCSAWMGGDLMTRARRARWREYICDVVLTYLRPGTDGATPGNLPDSLTMPA